MTTQTTLELIESAITSIEDGWTKSALETLKEARLQEKAMNQLRAGGIFPHASEANSDNSEQPAQHDVDWEKLYRLEVKKKEALAAKYERDTGKKLTRIVPMAEQPAKKVCKDSTPHLSVGDSSFESWYGQHLLTAPVHQGTKQHLRDAYAAGMGDPLVQPAQQQEPVDLEAVYETIIQWDEGGGKRSRRELARRIVDLYTPPPAQRKPWVGLTDEERDAISNEYQSSAAAALMIEAKLREKNAQPSKPLTDEQREKLRDAFAQALTSVYVCGRVWEAWQYGTMSEGDFQPAGECEEVLDSLIEAAHGIKGGA